MSSVSSSEDETVTADSVDDVEDADPVRDLAGSRRVHCSWSSIMRTSAEMSRMWEALHCKRELLCRCIRSNDVAMREYVGCGLSWAWVEGQSWSGGVEARVAKAGSTRRLC